MFEVLPFLLGGSDLEIHTHTLSEDSGTLRFFFSLRKDSDLEIRVLNSWER